MPGIVSIIFTLLISTGDCIKCFVGNVTNPLPENLVDCDTLGIQREELYCRNITQYTDGKMTVERSCVAMSWFDATWESMGCHESSQGATKLVRCTCETDHCNSESADWMQNKQVSGSSSISSAIPFHLSLAAAIYIGGSSAYSFLITSCIVEVMLSHLS